MIPGYGLRPHEGWLFKSNPYFMRTDLIFQQSKHLNESWHKPWDV
jgi:hypothetical protein